MHRLCIALFGIALLSVLVTDADARSRRHSGHHYRHSGHHHHHMAPRAEAEVPTDPNRWCTGGFPITNDQQIRGCTALIDSRRSHDLRATAYYNRANAFFSKGDLYAAINDYGEALKRHYKQGPPRTWQSHFISAYASAHPWEDFAETWAHYLHIVDALETARSYGVNVRGQFMPDPTGALIDFNPYSAPSAERLIDAWTPLTIALNGVNRSMGQPDLYPFVLNVDVMRKLEFIHDVIRDAGGMGASALAA